jgi:putative oxidoreductase
MTANPPRVDVPPVPTAPPYRFPAVLVGWARGTELLERAVAPLLDLVIRIALAQGFFVSAVLKLADWNTALFLATNEYPVTWLDPTTAAVLGVAIELAGSVLLAAGLATRAAAIALAALTIVVQTSYVALDAQLVWIALFGWYAVRGAGPISLDAAFARGLARSALPFGARIMRVLEWTTPRVTPAYDLALRAWLAAALCAAAEGTFGIGPATAAWLPWQSAAALPAGFAATGAILLGIGAGTRIVGLALLVFAGLSPGSDAQGPAVMAWAALGALLALHGPGRLSVDALLRTWLATCFPELDGGLGYDLARAPHVVIVGAGFGGLACAAGLRNAPVRITLIDRHNYHLFQPLLYQVATAALAPGDIATPIRGLFRDQPNARVVLGEVTGVDTAGRTILIGTQRVAYDYLVLACGARHSYFGRDEWEPYAPGLKQVEDATEVRRRLLTAFERAETTDDFEERRALLTFAIVGGGPTGVELAGAIAEIARFGMEKDFRNFDPAHARVLLIQAGPRILPTFTESLAAHATRALAALGVEVMVNSRVEDVDAQGVLVNGERIPARTVLWAAGVIASPAARWLDAEAERDGRVKVGPDLSVAGHPNVYAIGDTAAANAWKGRSVPGLAPAAKQGGEYLARLIRARVSGARAPGPFVYRHLGSLATIGRKAAVVDFGFIRLWGAIAWWLWGAVHVGFLAGFRSRVSVMLDWGWAYLTFRGGTRLITGSRPQTVR